MRTILKPNWKKNEDENDDQFVFRICDLKDSSNLTWQQVADIINEALNQNYTESAYRKKYQTFKTGLKACESQLFTDDEYLKELQNQTDKLYSAKKQMQDQRREYNKLIATKARADHLYNELIKAANSLNKDKVLDGNDFFVENAVNEAVLVLSDWHYGMVADNIWNTFDTDICIERIGILLNKAQKYCRVHDVNKLHIIVLGDLYHGSIHVGCRVASEENTCEQLMHVSEILAEFIDSLSKSVNQIDVYTTYGNHARTIQNKADSIHADNMERIVPWWLKQRLANNLKVSIIDSQCFEYVCFDVLGHTIVGMHGDLEKFDKIAINTSIVFEKIFGANVEYIFSADKHHNSLNDAYGIENVMVGSLCGTDEYANNRRLYSDPTQTLCIFNKEDGKLCTYNIKLKG